MMPEPMSDEQRVEMQAMARQAKEVAPKVPLSALYVERLADSILSLLTALEAAEARIVRLEIERNEWRRLFNDQPEFLTAVDCRLLAENERDALRAQLAAMEKENHETRRALWLTHGHDGLYGDDGEMQCAECSPYDYQRAPIGAVVGASIKAHRAQLAAMEKERDEWKQHAAAVLGRKP